MEMPEPARPTVSVIIPARNEEACLAACLQSLRTQAGIEFEIIVVNDGSTDRTREIAGSVPGVRVIDAPPLASGWIGKNNAVAAGARVATGDWLLFTDAETVHLPGSLRRGVAEAQKNGAALLSYSPEQVVVGFWQHAVMPVIFAELASTYQPGQVSDPASSAAAANGQYILVSRDAYEAVGGHAAIAGELLEDVALAKAVKRSGRRVFFRYGADAVRTRMYRNFADMEEGWTKNLALLFPTPGRLALLRLVEFVFLLGGAVAVIALAKTHAPFRAVVVGLVVATGYDVFLARIRKAHFRWLSNLLAIFGLPLFAYLLLRSGLSYRKGSVTWKGRSYMGTVSRQSVPQGREDLGSAAAKLSGSGDGL